MNEIENYISCFPEPVIMRLNWIREAIIKIAPEAEELISYGIPAYKLNNKPLVYFAAYKNHIGFYATPQGHKEFSAELSQFKQGKGSVQFPLDEELPKDLIINIVKFKVNQVSKSL